MTRKPAKKKAVKRKRKTAGDRWIAIEAARPTPWETTTIKLDLPRFTRISEHSTKELTDVIDKVAEKYGPRFWEILHGVDAYMERRRRIDALRDARRTISRDDTIGRPLLARDCDDYTDPNF